jgi:hypothetical protein
LFRPPSQIVLDLRFSHGASIGYDEATSRFFKIRPTVEAETVSTIPRLMAAWTRRPRDQCVTGKPRGSGDSWDNAAIFVRCSGVIVSGCVQSFTELLH